MSVPLLRVGDLLKLSRSKIDPVDTELYRQIGVYSWGKGIIEGDFVYGNELSKLSYYDLVPDALVLSNIQAWEAAIAVSGKPHEGFISSQRFLPYLPIDKDRIDVRYACNYFLSERGLAQIRRASPGSITRNRTLGMKAFEDIQMPVPKIDEQRAIAARLDAVVGLSRHSKDAMDRNAGLTSVIDSVSTAWQSKTHSWRLLGSIARISRGKSLRLDIDSDVTAIGQAAVRWRLERSLFKGIDGQWASTIPAAQRSRVGELLVNSTGDGTIGRASIVDESTAGYLVDSHVLRVHTHDPEDAELILLYLWSPTGRREVERIKGSTTTKQTELGISRLSMLAIPDFSTDQKMRYLSELRQLFAISTEYQALREQSLQLLKSLPQSARNAEFARLTA